MPSVAIFGIGHVGLELARILARQPIELTLVDSRAEMLAPERIGVPGTSGPFADAVATVTCGRCRCPRRRSPTCPRARTCSS